MALLPAVQNSPEPSSFDLAVARLSARGLQPGEIARKLAPEATSHERQILRKRIRRRLRGSPDVMYEVMQLAHEELVRGLVPTVKGMVGRAASGRSDAGKVILEMAGLYSPKTVQEHTGSIDIRLSAMPRPKAVDSTAEEDE